MDKKDKILINKFVRENSATEEVAQPAQPVQEENKEQTKTE